MRVRRAALAAVLLLAGLFPALCAKDYTGRLVSCPAAREELDGYSVLFATAIRQHRRCPSITTLYLFHHAA